MHDRKRSYGQRMFKGGLQIRRRRKIVAAVCYRGADGAPEFLLVRTRSGRWTFPKGGIERGECPTIAAAREAREEAGVLGSVEPELLAEFRYEKVCGGWTRRMTVEAFLFRVVQTEAPDEAFRNPTWFSGADAKLELGNGRSPDYAAELQRVIDRAATLLASRGCPG